MISADSYPYQLKSRNTMGTSPHSFTIALVAPIGVNLETIEADIKSELEGDYNFLVNPIKITKQKSFTEKPLPEDPYDKYMALMDRGDKARKTSKKEDILAQKALKKVKLYKKTCNVINQLKTPHEIELLRKELGKISHPLFVLSIFDTKENRTNYLSKKIEGSKLKGKNTNASLTEKLISRDEKDTSNNYGQNVREAFPAADFFIDTSLKSETIDQISRILKIIFSNPHISPTKEEYGMYLADASALRSRDLSRQVGASILDDFGSVVVNGCNEVPKAFGGCYWENDVPDNRDFNLQSDSNYQYRNNILSELFKTFESLDKKSIPSSVQKFFKAYSTNEKVLSFIDNPFFKNEFKKTRIMNLIEFGRSNHAEVDAISNAARSGVSIQSCTLYTTVFPCHLCARYIISSGIKEIVFIEPYPKSLTLELYSNEMSMTDSKRILLKSFKGVAPRAYRKAFLFDTSIKKKESDASVTEWNKSLDRWVKW